MSTFRLTSDKIDSHLHDVDINMNLALEICVYMQISRATDLELLEKTIW